VLIKTVRKGQPNLQAESLCGQYAKDNHGALHIISENTEMYVGNQLTLCDAPTVNKEMQDFLNIKMISTQEIREYAAEHGLTIHAMLPEGKARQMLNDHMEAVFKERALAKQKKADPAANDKIPPAPTTAKTATPLVNGLTGGAVNASQSDS
jgi:hypothetical protein